MASELERSLSEILSECAAPAALSTFLKTEGLTTCALFYDCVKNIDDLEGKVAARLVPAASSLRDLSVIRTVWRRAKVEAEKALSGSVDAPEDWEIPLNPTTKNALTSKSAAAYGTVFRARKMPCDSLLGRVYREREKQCLTAFPLGRVRSLATSPQTKERFLVVGRVVSCVVFFFGGGCMVSVAGFVRPSFGSLGSFVRSARSARSFARLVRSLGSLVRLFRPPFASCRRVCLLFFFFSFPLLRRSARSFARLARLVRSLGSLGRLFRPPFASCRRVCLLFFLPPSSVIRPARLVRSLGSFLRLFRPPFASCRRVFFFPPRLVRLGRSLVSCLLPGQLLGNGIVLEHGVAKGVDLSTTVYGYWLCLSVLLHAYIIVGVDGWCPKQVADDYLDLVEEKLWHPRSPGLAAVADVELQHRLRWVELTRGPEGKTLGEAIKTSMSELAGAWQYGPELSADSGVKRKREEPPKETKDYTIQESKGGVAICHSWNLGK